MIKRILEIVSKEFSGENAKELTGGIANYHRIQSSPGFRAAAKYSLEKFNSYKLQNASVLSYPAKGNNKFWGCPIPKEWSIKSASLDLVEPKDSKKNLSRFFEVPCSIIQRSKATPKEGITAEVMILPSGLKAEEIAKYNVKDKFILSDDPDLKKLRLIAVKKLGAAGIIYDLVSELKPYRTRANFPTARRYTSFWYGTKGDEGDALGFVLSAEQGNELRKLIGKVEKKNKERKKKGEKEQKVVLQAKIDASFYDGEMEVVEAFIPGEEKGQEVIAVAHLCHPKPSAVDNASGCGTIIEMARTLKNLITAGKLQKPKRGIRFLLMAEFTGTYCYLASHETKISEFVAGINLDMVGADQTAGGGRTLVMERTHGSMPSYVNDVLSALLNEASKEVNNFLNTGAFATFKYANDQPFSGGSDHYLLGYPDVGIGTPMFIQWPDRYYHTSEDTIEKVSPEMLHLVGSLTAAYCYFIANAEIPEILWMAHEVGTKGRGRLSEFARNYSTKALTAIKAIPEGKDKQEKQGQKLYKAITSIKSALEFRRDVEVKTLQSLTVLTANEQEKQLLKELVRNEKKALVELASKEIAQTEYILRTIGKTLNILAKETSTPEEDKEYITLAEKTIPVKMYRGPITGLELADLSHEESEELSKLGRDYSKMAGTQTTAFFWIDGKRTIAEIAKLVENEYGFVNVPYLVKTIKFYQKHGILTLTEK